MAFLGKTTIKKWAFGELKPFFKKYGFKKVNQFDNTFFHKIQNNTVYSIAISAGTGQSFSIGGAAQCLIGVEEILLKVIKFDPDINSLYFKRTFTIGINNLQFGNLAKGVDNQNDVIEVCNDFKTVFTDYYLPTFEHYSNPKNVLALWDSLDDKGKSDHFFSPYNYVKIIILSKMSNDVDYERRCQEAIGFYTMHYNNGIASAKELIEDCHKVIKYLAENSI